VSIISDTIIEFFKNIPNQTGENKIEYFEEDASMYHLINQLPYAKIYDCVKGDDFIIYKIKVEQVSTISIVNYIESISMSLFGIRFCSDISVIDNENISLKLTRIL
jgi:hypothetical protein